MRAFLKKLIRRHRKAIPGRISELDDLDTRLRDWEAALALLRAEADEATTSLRLRVLDCARRAGHAHARAIEHREVIHPGTRGWRQASHAVREELERLGDLIAGADLDRARH